MSSSVVTTKTGNSNAPGISNNDGAINENTFGNTKRPGHGPLLRVPRSLAGPPRAFCGGEENIVHGNVTSPPGEDTARVQEGVRGVVAGAVWDPPFIIYRQDVGPIPAYYAATSSSAVAGERDDGFFSNKGNVMSNSYLLQARDFLQHEPGFIRSCTQEMSEPPSSLVNSFPGGPILENSAVLIDRTNELEVQAVHSAAPLTVHLLRT